MNCIEKLKCIKKINPGAHCVVWEGGLVKYDASHKGKKPSNAECESIFSTIQSEMIEEEEKINEEELIRSEEKKIIKEQAIQSLKDKGKIFKHY